MLSWFCLLITHTPLCEDPEIPGIRKYSICSNTQCLPQQTCEIRVSVIQTLPQLQTIVHLICLSFSNFRHLYIRRKKLSPTGGNEALISQHIEISFDHGFHSQMPLGIRQITQQNTVCWQEIGVFTYKKEWCPSITGRPRGQNFFFLFRKTIRNLDFYMIVTIFQWWYLIEILASYSQNQTQPQVKLSKWTSSF